MKEAGEIILYQPDEEVRLEVRLEHETVWLTQEQIANLFGTKRPAITKHLNNIYNSGELDKRTTCSILEHVGKEYLLKGYAINQRLSELEQTVTEHSKKIDFFVRASLPPIEGVFYNGQIFDAYKLVADIIKSAKYPPILIKTYKNSHDRFLIIDNQEVYHIGASLKDLGKKLFAFSKLNEAASSVLKLIEE